MIEQSENEGDSSSILLPLPKSQRVSNANEIEADLIQLTVTNGNTNSDELLEELSKLTVSVDAPL